MNVREVLAKRDAFFGKVVTIEGFLVEKAPGKYLYLAPNDDSRDDVSHSIRVELSFSRNELDDRLPCWVGTQYAHVDPATLTGVLQPSDDGIFPAAIADLTRFTAVQDDEEIDILSGD